MRETFIVQYGVPIPETRGRKKGSVDRNHSARQAAISKGVALVVSGSSYAAAAKLVLTDYPSITKERMARLISQSTKVAVESNTTKDSS